MKRHNSLEEANPLHSTIFEKRATESSNYIQNIMHLKLGKPTRDNVKQFNRLLFLCKEHVHFFSDALTDLGISSPRLQRPRACIAVALAMPRCKGRLVRVPPKDAPMDTGSGASPAI